VTLDLAGRTPLLNANPQLQSDWHTHTHKHTCSQTDWRSLKRCVWTPPLPSYPPNGHQQSYFQHCSALTSPGDYAWNSTHRLSDWHSIHTQSKRRRGRENVQKDGVRHGPEYKVITVVEQYICWLHMLTVMFKWACLKWTNKTTQQSKAH